MSKEKIRVLTLSLMTIKQIISEFRITRSITRNVWVCAHTCMFTIFADVFQRIRKVGEFCCLPHMPYFY